MPQITWSNEMSTGISTLDELHRDIFDTLSEAASSTDENFIHYYSALVQKVERAFIKEERWMEKIDCDLLKTHREQHARVLSTLHIVHRDVLEADFNLGREVVANLLPQWYVVHVSTMDMALAVAIQLSDIETTDITSQPSGIYID